MLDLGMANVTCKLILTHNPLPFLHAAKDQAQGILQHSRHILRQHYHTIAADDTIRGLPIMHRLMSFQRMTGLLSRRHTGSILGIEDAHDVWQQISRRRSDLGLK